eukprot:g3563.t1
MPCEAGQSKAFHGMRRNKQMPRKSNHTSACPGPLLMGSGSSIQRGAKYKQGTSENALAEELHAQGQVVRSGPTSYRHRRMPKSGAGSMGVVCSQEANPLREEMSPTAMPQHWRKKWERRVFCAWPEPSTSASRAAGWQICGGPHGSRLLAE